MLRLYIRFWTLQTRARLENPTPLGMGVYGRIKRLRLLTTTLFEAS
jgi:hypothetical protein